MIGPPRFSHKALLGLDGQRPFGPEWGHGQKTEPSGSLTSHLQAWLAFHRPTGRLAQRSTLPNLVGASGMSPTAVISPRGVAAATA